MVWHEKNTISIYMLWQSVHRKDEKMEKIIRNLRIYACVMFLSLGIIGLHCYFQDISIAQAAYSSYDGTYYPESDNYKKITEKLRGNWADNKGNVLRFEGNYLNGCYIIRMEDMAGGWGCFSVTLFLEESDGVRKIRLELQSGLSPWESTFKDGGNEPVLRYNNSYYHRR